MRAVTKTVGITDVVVEVIVVVFETEVVVKMVVVEKVEPGAVIDDVAVALMVDTTVVVVDVGTGVSIREKMLQIQVVGSAAKALKAEAWSTSARARMPPMALRLAILLKVWKMVGSVSVLTVRMVSKTVNMVVYVLVEVEVAVVAVV